MVPQEDLHTGHQEVCPGNLAVSKPPRQGRHRLGAEAGACNTRPANRVGHEHSGETTREPSPLRAGQRVMGLTRANGSVHGVNKGTHKGGWFANHHRCLQAMGDMHNQRTSQTILAWRDPWGIG
jgi:hypothetical protein